MTRESQTELFVCLDHMLYIYERLHHSQADVCKNNASSAGKLAINNTRSFFILFIDMSLFLFFPGWNKLSWFISCQIITASFDQHLSYSNSPSVRHEGTFARSKRVIQKLLPDQQERWLVQNQFSKQNHKKKIVLDGHWKNKFHFRHFLPLHFPTVFCRFGFV